MDALSIVRAKFNQAKRLEKPSDESAEPSSTVKFYPLRNQDQNRLVQIMHRESFSSSDIYTSNLHRGILNDWLGTFELQGSIKLPSSSLLSIANAAVWNSRVRFNEILANKCHPTADTSAGSANSAQSLCLTDFVVTATADVPVLDTRVPGVPQSTATCIQTVLGDNLSVAVYHKVADGSVRQIATGRIAHISALSALSAPTSSSSTTSTYLSALEQFPSVPFDVSPFQSLRHCYDLPPQLVHAALMRAVQASGRDVGNALLQVAACDCFWVNNIRLPALWSSGAACRLFYQVVSSSTGLRVCVGLSGTGGGDPGETALALYMQAEVQVQGQTGVSCLHTEHPLQAPSPSVAWELRSRWVRDDAPPSTLVTGRKVRPRKLLCLVPADNTVNVDILDGLKVREEFAGCDIQCEGWPDVHSCDTSLSLEGTNRQGESKEAAVLDVDVSQCDVVVIVLPSYREGKSSTLGKLF